MLALTALSLPAFLAPWVGGSMDALVTEVDPASPYFTALDPLLLYVGVPVAAIGSIVLILGPGLLLTLGLGRGRDPWSWILESFLCSFLLISTAAALLQAAIDAPLRGITFAALTLLLFVPGVVLCRLRANRGKVLHDPLEGRGRAVTLLLLGTPALFLVALTPKFFWEAMNGDGSHGFETARLLLHGPLPFFPREAGDMAGWPGINGITYGYPPSWFIRLFGETPAASRLSFLLFMPLLTAGVAAIAEGRRNGTLTTPAIALITASIVSFALVMAYSATYNPYCADISMPGVHDALVMAFMLGALNALLRDSHRWAAAFTLLALLTSPAALMMCAATIAGLFLARRPFPWRYVVGVGLGFVACVVTVAALPHLLRALDVELPGDGQEHGAANLLGRYRTLALLDYERFGFALIPCGLYPVACLLFWRRSDRFTRALMIASGVVFLAYYVLARTSLHYYVPAMLLPLAAFWRQRAQQPLGRGVVVACAGALAVSLWLGLPAEPGIYVASHQIGRSLDVSEFEGYEDGDLEVLRASELMLRVLSGVGTGEVPSIIYGGGPTGWVHYAYQPAARRVEKRYKLSRVGAPAPPGAIVAARDHEFVIYVHDRAGWERDRVQKPPGSRGKDIYQIPRHILFNHTVKKERAGYIHLSMPGWLSSLLGR